MFCKDIYQVIPIILCREYENLKGSLRYSNEMSEKLKREVFASNNKVIHVKIYIYFLETHSLNCSVIMWDGSSISNLRLTQFLISL